MTHLTLAFDADEKDTMFTDTVVNKSQASVELGVGSGSASNEKLEPDPHRHQIDAVRALANVPVQPRVQNVEQLF